MSQYWCPRKVTAGILLCLVSLLPACSSISIMNYSGASMLHRDETERDIGVSYAPNLLSFIRDSSGTPNNAFDPLFEVRWRRGFGSDIELGGGIWTSGTPVSTIAAGSADLGGRFDIRYGLTHNEWCSHCVCIVGTFSGYYAVNTFTSFDEYERSYGGTWGGGGGIVYEYIVDYTPSPQPWGALMAHRETEWDTGIYAGAMLRYLYSDYTYGLAASESSNGVEQINAHIEHESPFLSPFVGLRLPGPICIEVCGLMVRAPSGGRSVWGVFGGVSFGAR